MVTAVTTEKSDIFISYQWSSQNVVRKLHQHLCDEGYRCWMDIQRMGGGDQLFEEIVRGLTNCKVVIACLTTKYTRSENCNREITFAGGLKPKAIPIIPILLEKVEWPPKAAMGFILNGSLYIDFSSAHQQLTAWKGDKVNELLTQLEKYVPDRDRSAISLSQVVRQFLPLIQPIHQTGIKLMVIYYGGHLSPATDRSEVQYLGKYSWGGFPLLTLFYSNSYVKCVIPGLRLGLLPMEVVRDALSPVFPSSVANIKTIRQVRGKVHGVEVAHVTSPDDEEKKNNEVVQDSKRKTFSTAVGTVHAWEEVMKPEWNVIVAKGSVLICGGGHRTVMTVSLVMPNVIADA